MFDSQEDPFNEYYLQLSGPSADPCYYELNLHHRGDDGDICAHSAIGAFVRAMAGNEYDLPLNRRLVRALIHRFNDYPALYAENELNKKRALAAYAHSDTVSKCNDDLETTINDHETEIRSLKQQLAQYKQRGIDFAHSLSKANETIRTQIDNYTTLRAERDGLLAQRTGGALPAPEKLLLTEVLGFLSSVETTSELNARYADRLHKDLITLINNM